MPRVAKLYKQSKGSLKHNAGPYNPMTKKEVKSAGSLREAYLRRGFKGDDSRQDKIFARLVEHPTPPVEVKPKAKKKPLLTRVGESLIDSKIKKGLKVTTER